MFTSHLSRLLPTLKQASTVATQAKSATWVGRRFSSSGDFHPVAQRAWDSYAELSKQLQRHFTPAALPSHVEPATVNEHLVVVVRKPSDQSELMANLFKDAREGKYAVVTQDVQNKQPHPLTHSIEDPIISTALSFIESHHLLHDPEALLFVDARKSLLDEVCEHPESAVPLLKKINSSWVGSGLSPSHFHLLNRIQDLAGKQFTHIPSSLPFQTPSDEWKALMFAASKELVGRSQLPVELKGLAEATLASPTDRQLYSEFKELADSSFHTATMFVNFCLRASQLPKDKATVIVLKPANYERFLKAIYM